MSDFVFPAFSWSRLVTEDNVEKMNVVIDAARKAVRNGGDFVLEGDPDVPTESYRFAESAFEQWLAHENAARMSLGKQTLG